ncbi:TOMM precursor leader peptide-binding protein [Nocardia sp. NPDC051052]|uniref:TOMM precursor leader peptide-binding protein n=1 Tax=Nocardia sp. NPDC051052 TaxID=3364322 RepID=UPI003791E423
MTAGYAKSAAMSSLTSMLRHRLPAGTFIDDGSAGDDRNRDSAHLTPDLAVHVRSGWHPDDQLAFARRWLTAGVPVLTVHREPGSGCLVVGPYARPGQPGCTVCADTRRGSAREDYPTLTRLWETNPQAMRAPAVSLLTWAAAELTGQLAAELVADQIEPAAASGTFLRLDLITLRVTLHRFLPDAQCALCAQPRADRRESAVITLRPQPKQSPDSYRVGSLASRRDQLWDTYVDQHAGIIHSLFRDSDGMFPVTHGRCGHPFVHGQVALGRQLSYEHCDLTALAEGLERYGGMQQGAKHATVRAAYTDIAAQAVDPSTLGLHEPEQYALPDFPFQPYTEDLVMDWVWGYSFSRGEPILVPATYSYYQWLYHPMRDQPFAYEISNGCALGGCLEEAILYGLLEVAERDSFLLTWYGRIPAPRIDIGAARLRTIPLMVERIERRTGCRVYAFDTTVEQGVPCSWVMTVQEHDVPGVPKALFAAGSHLEPELALERALLELAPVTNGFPRIYQRNHDRVLRMLEDPYQVQHMDDHRLLYCSPEAFGRLDFLLRGDANPASLQPGEPPSGDLTEDLRRLVNRYLATGLDVIVVDQTNPEHEPGGFRCVKVIVPGTLPMTFGHYARRLWGLERVLTVPTLLGYRREPLRWNELDLAPHPFP